LAAFGRLAGGERVANPTPDVEYELNPRSIMKLFKSKKRLVAVGMAAALAVGAAGAAFAYFTSTGDGSGSVSTGTSSAWQVDTDAATGGPLTPQPASCLSSLPCDTTESVAYRVTNNNTGQQNLANVAISVAEANGDPWTSGSCSASDFSINGEAAGTTANDTALAGNIAAGATTADSTITVVLIDNGANQDDCQGITSVPLYLHAT
jgi:hypothetical protein